MLYKTPENQCKKKITMFTSRLHILLLEIEKLRFQRMLWWWKVCLFACVYVYACMHLYATLSHWYFRQYCTLQTLSHRKQSATLQALFLVANWVTRCMPWILHNIIIWLSHHSHPLRGVFSVTLPNVFQTCCGRWFRECCHLSDIPARSRGFESWTSGKILTI